MKKKELKLIIGLMTQEILEQKAAARHYRQERDMKAMELRKAQQELRGGNDSKLLDAVTVKPGMAQLRVAVGNG